jgi:DNA-binding LacI/PurR family transcriptional regulator/biotin operon repressor
MPLIRHLLRNDVLAAIKSNIAKGVWAHSLPSERQLTDQYQISRGTLRYALKNLQEDGIIKAVAGSGYLITKQLKPEPKMPSSISIGILIGSLQGAVEARSTPWIPALQQRVAKRGWNLHLHEGIPEISRSPESGLRKLFKTTNHSCWLLVRCREQVQKTFDKQGIPAIICGSPYDGIELPNIDLNYQAIGRHAAGLLLSKGHRRIGYVRSRNLFPGDEECYKSFKETISKSTTRASIKLIRYSNDYYNYAQTLKQVKDRENPLTALFIDSPFQFLSIFTQALQAGIKIPEELSLISRHESDFLNHLKPTPACYEFNARERAHKIHQALEARIQGDTLRHHQTLLIPEYLAGESVTPPR